MGSKCSQKVSVWKVNTKKDPENCPSIPTPVVHLQWHVDGKTQFLMSRIDSYEWLAYLKGKWVSETDIVVYGFILPKQKVSAAHVDVLEYPQIPSIVGTIHSHVNMGNFWSGWDDDTVRSNHDLSIVTSVDQGYLATVRYKAPCGSYTLQTAEVVIDPSEQHIPSGRNPYHLPLRNIQRPRSRRITPWSNTPAFNQYPGVPALYSG